MLRRLRRKVRRPSDLVLALRIGAFMWRLPQTMRAAELPELLDRLRAAPRPPEPDPAAGVERIARLRTPWFRLPALAPYNTCFTRALTLYRFLDPAGRDLSIHFVVEPARAPGDRLRGHAWVTVDGRVVEEPDLRPDGRVREIYRHPPLHEPGPTATAPPSGADLRGAAAGHGRNATSRRAYLPTSRIGRST